MSTMNRRSFAAAAVVLPAAGLFGKAIASQGSGTATPTSSPGSTPSGTASPGASPAAAGIVIEGNDQLRFVPDNFEASPGDKVTLKSTGALEHNFVIDDLGGELTDGNVPGGQSQTFSIPDDAESGKTYDFYCSVPGHKEAGMVGKVTIK